MYRRRPVPRAWGWPVADGGRAADVEGGTVWQATTTQVCGLFPFAVASGAVPPGVPIGRHLYTAEPVGLDPARSGCRQGLVSNTGMWVQGQPGIGKSTIVKRLMTGLVAFGFHRGGARRLQGRVQRPGRAPRRAGLARSAAACTRLNPLDAGPLRAALAQTGGADRDRLRETIRARRLSLLEALVVIVRRAEITVTERRLLDVGLDLVVDADPAGEPTDPRRRAHPHQPHRRSCLSIAACDTAPEFRARHPRPAQHPGSAVRRRRSAACSTAPRRSTADLDTPALSLDISALDDDEDERRGRGDAVRRGPGPPRSSTAPRRSVGAATCVRVQDELWRALRVAPGLVERSDRVTRLGRHRGEVSIQVTHSLQDLEALPTEADRAKARGMAARNGVVVLGGLDDHELDRVSRITPLSGAERAMVRGWAAPPTWIPGSVHPGRGKYLIKSGDRTGLPVESGADRHRTTPLRHRPRLAATRDDGALGARGDGAGG